MSQSPGVADFQEPEISTKVDRMRHSAAHVMAHAVKNLYPHAKFGIGPTIENGFYYDMDLGDVKLVPEDLEKIEAEMKKITKANSVFTKVAHPIDEAISMFKSAGQTYKVEIIQALAAAGETQVTTFQEGDFIDLCKGPHIMRASDIGNGYKLMSIAGAYWRGKETNPMLTRIYGVLFEKKAELEEYLHTLEEAKKRDHRKLGKELDLFSFHAEAPASPFFHAKGALVYNRLIQFMRDLYVPYGYEEVITPQILDVSLWKTSGHYDNYVENMYFTQIDEREFAVKPMNCPMHTMIYSTGKRSYRDLPIRMADFGRLHRYEKSGVTAGLTRVRTFCQDDAHIFCTPDQIGPEIKQTIEMVLRTYEFFGFTDVEVNLSTRPSKMADGSNWDKAEDTLKKLLEELKLNFRVNAGDGAFYGPKIDFRVSDALKRRHQLGTIQLDFILPERFKLEFIGPANDPIRPVMVHRAIFGSLERFFGILLEHVAGAFPFWLAPVQVRLMPVADQNKDYVREFAKELRSRGLRVDIDDRNESLGLKTREVQIQKIPFSLVAGDRDIAAGGFAVRKYGETTMKTMTKDEIVNLFRTLNDAPKDVVRAATEALESRSATPGTGNTA
ncbi:MAG: threonine--tRNA ligase [Bdellovibrionales bacterium]|nr:threonine--tRNA ligase [Bdellovibrionales bacterium]